ncbi:PREDICTED: uncharacterized protein LOC105316762 [Amphimedon queenslandica]|uniref:Methyltransferase domain-containing protein n=1 Tax=Amphimedon queenslandica TaxID=400682 RepID=A0A1X7VHW0_AMPQE|nr:PREDICTED: uncharacterized protein LOC105316762 [Amphimedon queenslandica]|eukprot:XP_011410227.1 PREDICTED: uncharacterized protein LOC105316762 [Amphimedon queenslandica]
MEAAICYSQTSTVQQEDGMKLLNQMNPKEGDVLLDLGCGTGFHARDVAERVGETGRVVAVDPDRSRIEVAKNALDSNPPTNLQFIVASDKDFPADDIKYDYVLSSCVVHWIKDKESAFKRIYNSLKPGGKFGFTSQDDPKYPDILIEMLQLCGPQVFQETAQSIHWKSASYYKELAESIGFEVTLMDVAERTISFPDIEAFINFFYGVFHGKFDRTLPAIDGIREKYKGQSLMVTVPRLSAILTKPLNI